ncbi:MAG: YbhB/YbcL family Raf kinase inhibitor-like protein [archaeon]|nr:YbhB/YbcL family Raf kinase inhibitor-like protein [archaeon]
MIAKDELVLQSPAFVNRGKIPAEFTCDGNNQNPQLEIGGIPAKARTLALIMEDPDAPSGNFVHWVVWDIPPLLKIEKNSIPGTVGKNSDSENNYIGPCPPGGTHRYYFRVYALDKYLDLDDAYGKTELEKAMKGHVLAKGELLGFYSRQ